MLFRFYSKMPGGGHGHAVCNFVREPAKRAFESVHFAFA